MQFDTNHPFFDDALQFVVLTVSTTAIGLHAECLRDIEKIVNAINDLQADLKDNPNARMVQDTPYVVPDYPPYFIWRDVGFDHQCVMTVSDALITYLAYGGPPPTTIDFQYSLIPDCDLKGPDAPFPPAPKDATAVEGVIHTSLFETTICYIVGGAYERHKSTFASRDGGYRNWDTRLQFFRHMRNGCFHSNSFNILPERRKNQPPRDQIDPSAPPEWQGFTMPSDAAMNGKKVLGENGFLSALHILPLLHDIGQLV